MDSPSFDLIKCYQQAAALVREHTIVLWWVVLLGLLNILVTVLGESEIAKGAGVVVFILSLCSTPVIYGIYYELIEDDYSSVTTIIRSYVLPYLWLLIRMYVPVIVLAWIPVMLSPQSSGGGYFHLLLVSFSLLYLYVIPFYYFSGKQDGSITRGITFLFKTLGQSTPLLLVVLIIETILLLVQYTKIPLLTHNILLYCLLDFSTYVGASIIDFVLFIVIIQILKNEVGKNTLT